MTIRHQHRLAMFKTEMGRTVALLNSNLLIILVVHQESASHPKMSEIVMPTAASDTADALKLRWSEQQSTLHRIPQRRLLQT